MPEEKLNIHQKLLKISDMAGVLQKDKQGDKHKYVPEDEIQAKVTAGMQKYGVMLYTSLVPGTFTVLPSPCDDQKPNKRMVVHSEVLYKWVNVDNPSEVIENRWAYVGQMHDPAQAFGAGVTYGNRYYLLKALQLATTEDDPDTYRDKQEQADKYETEKAKKEAEEELKGAVEDIRKTGSELIKGGVDKVTIRNVVEKHNGGNPNLSSVTSLEVCKPILEELKSLQVKKNKQKEPKKAEKKENE
jgi:hypothetical protein